VNPNGASDFNELRLSVAAVGHVANEAYADLPELRDLCLWLHGYCLKVRHVWKRSLTQQGIEHALVIDVWRGKADAEQLKEFVRQVKPFRAECGTANKGGYANTSFAQIIWGQLNVALRHSQRGHNYVLAIEGDAGCGKTTIFKAWSEANNHGISCYYRAQPCGGLKTLLSDLAHLNGADSSQNLSRTWQTVRDCFWPGRVLIIDEAHLLVDEDSAKQRKIEVARTIADECQCAVVLGFTDDRFESAIGSRYPVRQLTRRGRFIHLHEQGTDEDIEALVKFRAPNLKLTEKLWTIFKSVNGHDLGGFGGVANLLIDADEEADREGIDLGEQVILRCAKMQYDAEKGGKEKTLRALKRYSDKRQS
jgi:hypothetical protein